MNTKDFLDDNYKIKAVQIIDDVNLIQTLNDEKYAPVMKFLREKPLSVKDIRKRYNAELKKPKEEVTIRQYLKVLEDSGLILKAGQRITDGKIAAETLYGRAAKYYLPVIISEDYWESEENKIVIKKVLEILQFANFKKQPDMTSFRKLLHSIYSKSEMEIAKIFDKYKNEISDLLIDSPFNEIKFLSSFLMIAVLLTNQQFFKQELEDNFY